MGIKRGDLFFTRDDSLWSKTVSLVETGEYGRKVPTHVGIVTFVGKEIAIIEATYPRVRYATLDQYNGCEIWFARMKGERQIENGLMWAYKQVGTSYDLMQLVGIWARGGLRLLGHGLYERSKFIRNFLNSKQRFICSELIERYAIKTGGRLWHGDIGDVTPFDLWKSTEIDIYEHTTWEKEI